MYFRGQNPRKGSTITCTVKTMRQMTCTDRPYRLASAPECLYYSMYYMPSVQRKVPYAVAILVQREDRAVVTSSRGLRGMLEFVRVIFLYSNTCILTRLPSASTQL